MHKKYEINWTNIKGGCQSGRKVITHNSKSDLPLGDLYKKKELTPRLPRQHFLPEQFPPRDHHLQQPLRPVRQLPWVGLRLQILKGKLESLLESKIFFIHSIA